MKNPTIKKSAMKIRSFGPVMRKIIILLGTGLALGLSRRPDTSFDIIDSAIKAWREIDKQSLQKAIRRLYESKLITQKEMGDGTIQMVLSESGKKKFIQYNLETIKIKKPIRWDGLWRVVVSDIPENRKKERDTFSAILKRLGFLPLQKSVFIYPYPCDDELDFIIETYNLRKFVRHILANKIDIDLALRKKFYLL